jgi:competence protein ComEC
LKLNNTYIFVGSFILGVALFSIISIWYLSLFLLIIPALFYKSGRYALLIAIVAFAMCLGGTRVALLDLSDNGDELVHLLNQEVELTGIVITEPSVKSTSQRITLEIVGVEGNILNTSTRLITSIEKYPRVKYGDEVRLKGTLEKPENFLNEQKREFNYIDYLRKDGIGYTMAFPESEIFSSGNGNIVKQSLFFVKQKWLGSIEKNIPDPHTSLLGGLVVGAKESLGEKLEDDFRKTGIIHIVVLSGYNVTIVAEAFMRFFSFLPRMMSLSLGAISIVFFAILTGGSATIVRASIMALLVLLARATGRTSEITHALFIAGFFMVLHNPLIVLYDPSFQLSFLATVGLIYVSPIVERKIKIVPSLFQLREFASATISTQLFVLPLLLYMMGEMSLVAVPVNILILAFIPLTMFFGFLAGIFGLISSFLALPFTTISYILLSYELFVVELFANLPFASVSISNFSLPLMFGAYCLYILLLYRIYSKSKLSQPPSILG